MSNSHSPEPSQDPSKKAAQGAEGNRVRKARAGNPLRRALEDLTSTSGALDKARSALRAEAECRSEARKRNADLIRELRRQLHKADREIEYARNHVASEKSQREEAEDREVQALRSAGASERQLKENSEELEQLRGVDREAAAAMAAKVEGLEDALAGAQARVEQTESAHGTIRERIVALELELGKARARTVKVTQSRDEERLARGKAEEETQRLERELAASFDRGEDLLSTVEAAGVVERGLQRYADKKETQLISAEQLLIEAHHRLGRIGNEIATARRRVGIAPRPSAEKNQPRANLG